VEIPGLSLAENKISSVAQEYAAPYMQPADTAIFIFHPSRLSASRHIHPAYRFTQLMKFKAKLRNWL
jgi:hypothetical protein